MKWASSASKKPVLGHAAEEVLARVRGDLPDALDLAVVFVSPHHFAHYDELSATLRARLRPRVLIGCSAGGVIGGGREIEESPGLSLTAASLPGVELAPFHLSDPAASNSMLLSAPSAVADEPDFLLLADPFTFDAEGFLRSLDARHPRSTKIGGLASGGRQPGENVLYLDGGVHRGGL